VSFLKSSGVIFFDAAVLDAADTGSFTSGLVSESMGFS